MSDVMTTTHIIEALERLEQTIDIDRVCRIYMQTLDEKHLRNELFDQLLLHGCDAKLEAKRVNLLEAKRVDLVVNDQPVECKIALTTDATQIDWQDLNRLPRDRGKVRALDNDLRYLRVEAAKGFECAQVLFMIHVERGVHMKYHEANAARYDGKNGRMDLNELRDHARRRVSEWAKTRETGEPVLISFQRGKSRFGVLSMDAYVIPVE